MSKKIESIQRMAFRIILPLTESYDEALMLAQIPTLESRREYLCKEYMSKMKKKDHPLHFMLPKDEWAQV